MRHFRLAVRTSEKLVEGEMLNEPAPALFQQQWQLYRKFVDNNYFYHREVYVAIGQSPCMSRGSVCRYTTSSPRPS